MWFGHWLYSWQAEFSHLSICTTSSLSLSDQILTIWPSLIASQPDSQFLCHLVEHCNLCELCDLPSFNESNFFCQVSVPGDRSREIFTVPQWPFIPLEAKSNFSSSSTLVSSFFLSFMLFFFFDQAQGILWRWHASQRMTRSSRPSWTTQTCGV